MTRGSARSGKSNKSAPRGGPRRRVRGGVRKKNATRRKKPARRRTRSRGARSRSTAAAPQFLRFSADAGVALLTLALALAGLVAYYARDLPSTDGLWRSERAPRLSLVASDGSPMPVHGQRFGAPVRLAALPAHVPQAVLAVEDRNFYHHIGVNPVSVARAFLVNTAEGEVRQGGSTLTQQLAKNLFLSSERTFKRKLQELLLALWLEQRFTKDEILTLYLNRVYFGAGAYGIDAASYRYFGKSAQRLTLSEAAVLAGLLKAPSQYAPTRNPEDAGRRARIVIDAMVEAGFLTTAEAAETYRAPVMVGPPQFAGAPYFVDYALNEAKRVSKGIDADLIIRTSHDPVLQRALENGVAAALSKNPLGEEIQVAGVILDKEGGVLAMIGGRDYAKSQFNRAVQARRQPGSAFKPFVFLAALEQGAAPDQLVLDAPIAVGKWTPENYKGKYYGEVSMTKALALSLNSATIRVQERAGRNAVRIAAHRMGLEDDLSKGAALGLGVDAVSPLELAGAYAPFANGGFKVDVHGVEEVATADGDLIYRRPANMIDIAASQRSINAMNAMLEAVTIWGTGKAAALDRFQAAGKTGTTQDSRDAWFAGHAGGLVAVVWVGRDDNKPMDDVTGGAAPAAIWREVMNRALDARPSPAPRYIAPMIIDAAPTNTKAQEKDPLAEILAREAGPGL